jgi:hypothetical protein
MATPLINALRVQGGTFYTFTSASNDISKTFTDDDARFVFSKFALLDLPDVYTPSTNYENYIVWEALGVLNSPNPTTYPNSSVPFSDISTDNNINLAQSLQNYLLNFEQLVLDGSNTLAQSYDFNQKWTVSERLFWKWLANINAIRFRNSTAAESTVSNRFTEEDPSSIYKKVVKYIGDVDIVNSVSRDGHSYSEVYLNVPVTHGNTPLVLFKTYQDANYSPGRQWSNGNNYIDGRDSGSVHPSGLSLTAYYDNDVIDAYLSAGTFGNPANTALFASSTALSTKPVLLSSMDGIILDTDADSYKPIVDDPNIELISEFNASDASTDFSFNAALVYYDVYSASNPLDRARNLYGILILDDYVNQTAAPSYLKRFDKFKPNKVTKLNGNGYGLKLNLKFDTSADNVGVETIINDYSTFSMDLFIDASTRMQEAADQFLSQNLQIVEIKQQISELQQYFFSQGDINGLSQRISALETSLNNAQLAFSSSTTLLDLINLNTDNINSILSGNLTTNLTYNTDVLRQGDGILLDRSVPNQVKVISRIQAYNNFMLSSNSSNNIETGTSNGQDTSLSNLTDSNILVLGTFTNFFRQTNQNPDPITGIETFGDTVYVNIDDKNVRWKNGQMLKFVFNDKIDTGGFNIVFKTDSQNVFGNGNYGKIMVIISPSMLLSNRPILEIYCTDENQYLFNVDVIR